MFLTCPYDDFNPFVAPALIATIGVAVLASRVLRLLIPIAFRGRFIAQAKDEMGRQVALRRAELARNFAVAMGLLDVPLLLATGWLWLQTGLVISYCNMSDAAFNAQSQRIDIAFLLSMIVLGTATLATFGGSLAFSLVSLTLTQPQDN